MYKFVKLLVLEWGRKVQSHGASDGMIITVLIPCAREKKKKKMLLMVRRVDVVNMYQYKMCVLLADQERWLVSNTVITLSTFVISSLIKDLYTNIKIAWIPSRKGMRSDNSVSFSSSNQESIGTAFSGWNKSVCYSKTKGRQRGSM